MTTVDHRQTHPAHNDRSCNYSRTSLSRTLGRSRGSSARIDSPSPRLILVIRDEDRLVARMRERGRMGGKEGGREREREKGREEARDSGGAILPQTMQVRMYVHRKADKAAVFPLNCEIVASESRKPQRSSGQERT
ncbi:hypothetical protein PUN28_018403 [Cardiocondyla obscurior]|uniref:Uncharacterized protein n=1 Tax=Cardiocondyla obscurior TaxID=286306 RepID=A0AAW2EIR4_9HYME